MTKIFYCQYVCIFNYEKHCRNILPHNVSLICNLQDSLNHFIILILLDSEYLKLPGTSVFGFIFGFDKLDHISPYFELISSKLFISLHITFSPNQIYTGM